MKQFIAVIAITTLSITSFAARLPVSKDFYECGGLAGVDEYRVGIDLKTGKAGFFDNDNTSILKLTETKFLESLPPQKQMIYEGKDLSGAGFLKLFFNLTRKTVTLYSYTNKLNMDKIGTAKCVNAVPWDL